MHNNKIPFSKDLITDIVNRFGTPTYIYDETTIRTKCRDLKEVFGDLPVKWLYAIKANDNPFILDVIAAEGFGFDTVSFEEVLLSLHFQNDPKNIFYTENNMTDREMEEAIEAGISVNIGSLSRLESFFKHPGTRNCSIRIKPDIGDGHHERVVTGSMDSKFGIRMDMLPECLEMANKYGKKITGLHMHIGSGIKNAGNLADAMKKLLKLTKQFPNLEMINFGGGIPVPYREDEEEFSLNDLHKIAYPILKEDYEKRSGNIIYRFEPGRYVVAQSGALVTRVITVKDQGRKIYLGTDTGFNHLARPMIYDAYHRVYNINHMDRQATQIYEISGNICESGDILAENRPLPETQENDILLFADTGAYGMTMASEYNRRAYPAEVLVKESKELKLIRPRKSAEETISDFFRDTGYKS